MNLPFTLGALRVLSPAWLAALLALPLFFAAASGTRRGRLAAACRSVAATALLLTLAGLYLERARPAAGTCIVAAIDVSASVQRAAAESARAFLARLAPALGPHDLLGSIAFAARAHVVAHPASRRPLAALIPAPPSDVTGFETGDTDLAAAVSTAAPLCPEEKQATLALFTDGNETEGSLLAEAALIEPRVPIFPILPPPTALPAATIRRLLAPAFAPEYTALPFAAVVESRAATPLAAALELTVNGTPLALAPIELSSGLSVLALPYRLQGAGQYLLEARLRLPATAPQAPGRVRAALSVTRPLQVLVVSEHEAPAVAAVLAARGMRVEIVAPPGFAARVSRLRQYHLVVLEDVARAGFGDAALAELAAYVAGGGALVVTGGEHLFGDPGFVGSPLERVLPVELQSQTPEPQEHEPIAVYLVIDRSNSMGYAGSQPMVHNGEKMEYAKRAALAVLDQLGARDLVAAIAFDAQPYELGPLQPAGESRAALGAKIQQIQYGGGTDFKDALDIARRHLIESGRRVRHVILLTDGDTNRGAEDHAELIAALTRAEITVTTIRIGNDTINLDLLDAIARATGGEFHHVENVRALPQLLVRDAQRLMHSTPEHEERAARLGEAGSILAGITEDELPPISRWAITRAKHGAELRLYVDAGERRDPLLATWQYELGRVAVVPVDFQAGAAAWPAWNGFGKLWAQLALWAAPQGLAADRRLEARRLREGTLLRLETVADDAGPFVLRLPAGDVALRQTGRRTFSAIVPSLGAGMHPALLLAGPEPRSAEEVEFMVPPSSDSGREYRTGAPDRALLERVAALTGGTVDPEPTAVLAARPGVAREVIPLAGILIPLALAFLLADIAVRRLARADHL
jgi:Mg-chelatase subunit ChlD